MKPDMCACSVYHDTHTHSSGKPLGPKDQLIVFWNGRYCSVSARRLQSLQIHICMSVCVYVYYVCVFVCLHMCTNIYELNTHTKTHTHIRQFGFAYSFILLSAHLLQATNNTCTRLREPRYSF